MITEEKAIDTIYDINCLSSINQIMFKIMKSEALLIECDSGIETQVDYLSEPHLFSTPREIDRKIIALTKVKERLSKYRYNRMLELQEYIENILPIEYKF